MLICREITEDDDDDDDDDCGGGEFSVERVSVTE